MSEMKNNNIYIIISIIAALIIGGGGWKIYQNQQAKEAAMQERIKAAEVAAEQAKKVAATPAPTQEEQNTSKPKTRGVITGTYVYMRTGPGTNYDTLGYFYRGETVKIIKVTEDWYQVRRKDGTVCWVAIDYCEAN